ncbi:MULTISPECIES: MliC family protein [Chromobacterium]|nr:MULTISPECIES: MliC family protein [Chromobacterium]
MKAWKSALLGATLLSASCAAAASASADTAMQTVKYRCNGSKMVVVEYPIQNSDAAIRLSWNNHRYRLTPTKVAQGERYISQQLIWSLLDEQARLTTRGGRVLAQSCHKIQLQATADDA